MLEELQEEARQRMEHHKSQVRSFPSGHNNFGISSQPHAPPISLMRPMIPPQARSAVQSLKGVRDFAQP